MKIDETADVFLNQANFAQHAFFTSIWNDFLGGLKWEKMFCQNKKDYYSLKHVYSLFLWKMRSAEIKAFN